jgi:hypothetical protein
MKSINKQLEAVKKEAEESAKEQAKKMEELNKALLASQQKYLDSAKQAEV